jgi:GT2 family glycosyltransferase
MKIEIICATRLSEDDFRGGAALGLSLRRLAFDKRIEPKITFSNLSGLPVIYNKVIAEADDETMLVFIHDDVWIDDYYFCQRVEEGLRRFDIIGIAGNRRRVKRQPAWAFTGIPFVWDEKVNLSGAVAHGKHPFGNVSYYGAVPAECELLDGVFLAAKKSLLSRYAILFDERFDFHCYDMDFCRAARAKSLKIGTWPISLTHQSGGNFGTEQWMKNYRDYLDKWGE